MNNPGNLFDIKDSFVTRQLHPIPFNSFSVSQNESWFILFLIEIPFWFKPFYLYFLVKFYFIIKTRINIFIDFLKKLIEINIARNSKFLLW